MLQRHVPTDHVRRLELRIESQQRQIGAARDERNRAREDVAGTIPAQVVEDACAAAQYQLMPASIRKLVSNSGAWRKVQEPRLPQRTAGWGEFECSRIVYLIDGKCLPVSGWRRRQFPAQTVIQRQS